MKTENCLSLSFREREIERESINDLDRFAVYSGCGYNIQMVPGKKKREWKYFVRWTRVYADGGNVKCKDEHVHVTLEECNIKRVRKS